MRQVVGIDANAVTADEAGREAEEVPFGPGCGEDLMSIDRQSMKDCRELVHQGNIEVALRVLDDLRSLGGLDVWRTIDARGQHRAVDIGHTIEGTIVRSEEHTSELQSLRPLVCR